MLLQMFFLCLGKIKYWKLTFIEECVVNIVPNYTENPVPCNKTIIKNTTILIFTEEQSRKPRGSVTFPYFF